MADTVTVTNDEARETVTIDNGDIVTIEHENVSVVSVGTQGPAGPPGTAITVSAEAPESPTLNDLWVDLS